jgi:hypothetical protein
MRTHTDQTAAHLDVEQLENMRIGAIVHSLSGAFKRVACKTWADSDGGWRPCHYLTGRAVAGSRIRPSWELVRLGVRL